MSTSGMHRRPFEGRHLVVEVVEFLLVVLLFSVSEGLTFGDPFIYFLLSWIKPHCEVL